jgi:hypothetical protein
MAYILTARNMLFDIVNTDAINAFCGAPVGVGAKRRQIIAFEIGMTTNEDIFAHF